MTNYNINAINFSYSPSNRFAREYQYARRQFLNADYQLKNSKPNSVEKYVALLRNAENWSKRTRDISQKANIEEQIIKNQKQNEQNARLGNKINYLA